jgi:hypothetical protein
MLEAVSLAPKAVILKPDENTDFAEIANFIIENNKTKDAAAFPGFAARNRITDREFKFNRDECYDHIAGQIPGMPQ